MKYVKYPMAKMSLIDLPAPFTVASLTKQTNKISTEVENIHSGHSIPSTINIVCTVSFYWNAQQEHYMESR